MLSQGHKRGEALYLPAKAQRQSKRKATGSLVAKQPLPSASPKAARASKRLTSTRPKRAAAPSSASGSVSPSRPLRKSAEPAISRPSPTASMQALADLPSETQANGVLPTSQRMPALSDLCHLIRDAHRRRQDFHRPEKSMTLVIESIARRMKAHKLRGAAGHVRDDAQPINAAAPDLSSDEGQSVSESRGKSADIAPSAELGEDQRTNDAHPVIVDPKLALYVQPFVEVRASLAAQRKAAERQCAKLSKQLPVWPWVESVNGFGALGLAQIVGECGDLSNYANPAKVWKRMGLHVVDGKAACKSKAKGDIMGYSPIRRSISWNIGSSLLKKQNPYREIYDQRKIFEQQKVPDGTKMLWHRRAQRYVEKRLLRDLWRAWRDSEALAT